MTQEPSRSARASAGRPGRRPATSPGELENAAFDLFVRNGFEETTVDDIARAAGVARRTFFRYFDSKNDVVWGNFSEELEHMRAKFAECPEQQPVMDAVRTVVVEFNRVPPREASRHRTRLELILRVPALQAHSTLRYAEWRTVVAEFVAWRLGVSVDTLVPQALAHAALGVAVAAYEQWLGSAELELCDVLDTALADLARGFTPPA